MSTVDSILRLLEGWPAWKRITQAPDRVDALERRVAALEQRLDRVPGEPCPKCGTRAMRATGETSDPTFAVLGVRRVRYVCENCGYELERQEG
jgi:predicted RNA-binding Zn-ribbon protein involved in translation (DUF1610 family)